MTDKVREALEAARGQLVLLHSLANDTTEANWRDKRLYVLQTCVRMSDALAAIAALDAETEGSASINAIAVKPLEWVVPKSGYGQEAYSILGKYWVLHGQFWSPGCTVSKPCRDDAAAKSAAQADFERRIRSALVPPEARS